MKFSRSAGILLHPTCLPGPYGVGDLGPEAFAFLDFLSAAGQKIWQVLPLNPTGYGDSPYQCFSAFAGNPLLISLDLLREESLLTAEELDAVPPFPAQHVNFGPVIDYHFAMLRKAAQRFLSYLCGERKQQYEAFCTAESEWLEDYALFMAAKDAHGGQAWTAWDAPLGAREPRALAAWREKLATPIAEYKFWQFEFFRQWRALHTECKRRGLRVMGDVPIYVAHDSVDVWTAREFFWLDTAGHPAKVAGVPPDYFSATGQLWGNPTYRWDRLEADGFQWWIRRMRGALKMYDTVRIDHFRGFEAYYEIPAGETTAQNGRWVKAPGNALFEALAREFGELPIVAENLGHITPEVDAMRRRFAFPGMAILQFAFGTDPQAPSFRPHNYQHDLVAYTGGHDNDTTVGWWTSGIGDSTRNEQELRAEYELAGRYLNLRGEQVPWSMIRALYASVADTVLVPLQDVMGLGSEARMNLPGHMAGNWRWRFTREQLQPGMAERLRGLAELYER
ncbi:MAG: 4-alpha-glucanotransferase [Acidobacteriota bacterium]|nr:4-alpha-glucanotransferase [Acidobacteriota bacterium]